MGFGEHSGISADGFVRTTGWAVSGTVKNHGHGIHPDSNFPAPLEKNPGSKVGVGQFSTLSLVSTLFFFLSFFAPSSFLWNGPFLRPKNENPLLLADADADADISSHSRFQTVESRVEPSQEGTRGRRALPTILH